jgi:peptidoglycan pentaglycine glycine transferase (the first glycine)
VGGGGPGHLPRRGHSLTAHPPDWDRLVAASPVPHLLQSWEWGELQSGYGWGLAREVVPVDGLQVPVSIQLGSIPGFGRYGYVPKGPVVDPTRLPEAMAALGRRGREMGLAFVRVEPEAEKGSFTAPGWWAAPTLQPYSTSILDLRPAPEDLLASFKPKTRYNIRLAAKKGVEVGPSDDIAAFAALSDQTSSRHHINLAPERYYRDLHRLLSPGAMCRLYLARHEGRPLAGIIVTIFAGRATYLFGASSSEGRHLMPAYLLHWQAIQDLRESGALEYDLWGIPPSEDPAHPWAGLWQFKSGWNGRMVTYAGAFDLPLKPLAWRAHTALSRLRGGIRGVRSRRNASG